MLRDKTKVLLAVFLLRLTFCCGDAIANPAVGPASSTKLADPGKILEEKNEPFVGPTAKRGRGSNIRDWDISGVNTLRFDFFDTFMPKARTLDNTYSYAADRLALTFKYENAWTTFTAGVNGLKFFGLPKTASAGLGQAYYVQNGMDSDHSKVYLRALNFAFQKIGDPTLSGKIGRFDYSSGMEYKGVSKKVEMVKSMRIADRVFGPFGFSYYQRSMNGIALNRDNGRFHLGASAWCPTAGGFSKQAGDIMQDIKVITLAGTWKFDRFIRNQELQVFFYHYGDHRPVFGPRGDNSVNASGAALASTGGVDVNVKNYGFSLVGAYDHPGYVVDTVLWAIAQRGDWYELAHHAHAFAVEAGRQWKKAPWTPLLRIGWNQSSGDGNPNDGDHETFFQMLPTARLYSWSTVYNLMNNRDLFLQIILKPNPKLGVRADYHQLRLTESADRWYTGAGAVADSGASTGFGARPTGGSSDLGKVLEIQGTYTFNKTFSTTLYLSQFTGGTAAANAYPGEMDQKYSFLELVCNF